MHNITQTDKREKMGKCMNLIPGTGSIHNLYKVKASGTRDIM